MSVIDFNTWSRSKQTPHESELRSPLSEPDAGELLSYLKYYDRKTVRNAVINLHQRDETPLYDHWESEEAFLFVYDVFKKFSKSLNQEKFCSLMTNEELPAPEDITLNRDERELLTDKHLFRRESRSLLKFFDSMNDFFEYEVILISLGYPCSSVA